MPLVHYDDLPRIEHSPWMKRELEHVLLKQELELKSRKNDIKQMNAKLNALRRNYRSSSPSKLVAREKKRYRYFADKDKPQKNVDDGNEYSKPIGKSYSTGDILNLNDRRKFNVPHIAIPNSSMNLVSFMPERDVHTPEVTMQISISPHSTGLESLKVKETAIIENTIKRMQHAIEMKKAGFERQITYIEKPLAVARHMHKLERQESWLKLIAFIQTMSIMKSSLKRYRADIEAMQELNLACARIQSTFRSAFVRKANKKMERVARLLREKAWIARLNVRTGKRRKFAMIVRRFTIAASKVGKFSTIIRKYRNRVVFCQRFIRSFFKCQKARLKAMSKKWRLLEKSIVTQQTLQENEEEKRRLRKEAILQEKAAKKARSMAAQKKEERLRNSSRNFRLLIRDIRSMTNSLDAISYRTRIGADEDDAVALAMKKEEMRRKKRMMNRTTSKAIRYKVLKEYLKRKRYRFITKKLDFIGENGASTDNIKVKLTRSEMTSVLKGESNPTHLLAEKRKKIIQERNSRMIIIYSALDADLPRLIRKGLRLQKEAEKAELEAALRDR